jgi:cellulose synthase/poly-beta-1,6-N-acetylglucosamine synthase-like glycosyltransferase
MAVAAYLFWACAILVIHTYVLYPLLLFLAYSTVQIKRDWRYLTGRRDRRRAPPPAEQLPAVSLVVAAYNEQARLLDKIRNVGELDYPPDKLEVIIASDGSTDQTNDILRSVSDAKIRVLLLPTRRGKPTALNHAIADARHDVVIFSDGATLFAPDAVKKLVRHFADPKVGVVCGALQFIGSSEFKQTEGLYWTYECMLRLMEARLGATLTASGAFFALRRACYRPLAPNTVIDDFVLPMEARRLGYRVVYDPEAVATDFAASSVEGEFVRRVRIAVGSFRALGELVRVPLDAFAFFAFVSHKILRWVLPFLLMGLLAMSGLLAAHHPVYALAFVAQVLFYFWAALGFVFRDRVRGVRYALVGYYLVAIHVAFLVGFFRFVSGRDEVAWHRVS